MNPISKGLRLWRTLRHLKPVQVYGRVWFRLARPKPDLRPAPAVRPTMGAWAEPARREASMVSPTQLRFLSEERDLDAHGWDDKEIAKLWRYNLHYFDDLAAIDAASRAAWHRALIGRWMRECAPGRGTAWEPYPTSLRIVNWIKWIRAGNEPLPGMLDSLAAQTRFLVHRLEWHLLGNHLFVNAKALVIAGHFFDGPEAEGWRERGWRILRAQIPEQILDDGGQFERSPMYHALAVEDMLDLLNALRAYSGVTAAEDERLVASRVGGMRAFLRGVCHPDGEVAFFNDSAGGVAPTKAELDGYAARLGLPACDTGAIASAPVECFLSSGFVRIRTGPIDAILDVGPVGPDYLPGHAHADTLSFELSVGGRRVLVNSGTSLYGSGAERLRQRGTAAHNTLTVDGLDSSEVWGGFRVARRAKARLHAIEGADGRQIKVRAEHDGYRRLGHTGLHERSWEFSSTGSITVTDRIRSAGEAESHWHFDPAFEVTIGSGARELIARGNGFVFRFRAEGADWRVSRSTYHPKFGVSVPNWKATARLEGAVATVDIEWQPCTSSS
jgi:uncharacterized heparinase superfamily protein